MQIAPYVSDRKKKRKRRQAYLFAALAILILYGVFFVAQWFVLRSPIFRVDHVVVTGNSAVASSDILALVQASALPKHDILPAAFTFGSMFLWPTQVATDDLQMITQLADVSVAKDYFSHTVTLTATERAPAGVWCFSQEPGAVSESGGTSTATTTSLASAGASCYWFDDTGTIFERSSDAQGDLIYVVDDSAQSPKGLGEKVLSDEFLPNFLSILSVLQQSGLGVKAIELNDLGLEEMDVITTNGPTIYFSLRFSADEYLPVIQSLMLQPTFDRLQYIDCRTENRVFYK
jgi:hypothetical protein